MKACSRMYRTTHAISGDVLTGSLVDGGCNGGLSGDDVRVIDYTTQKVDVHGIDNTTISSVPIGTVA